MVYMTFFKKSHNNGDINEYTFCPFSKPLLPLVRFPPVTNLPFILIPKAQIWSLVSDNQILRALEQ